MCMAPNSMLSRFTIVLLDMNGTFMFGGDRFGPEQDFAATYHALGGRQLPARVVQDGVVECFETLGVIYDDSAEQGIPSRHSSLGTCSKLSIPRWRRACCPRCA